MAMYLENVLGDFKTTANVMVLLSSQTVYGLGEIDEPIVSQDCCGNHSPNNWLKAIEYEELEKMFLVDKVECKSNCGDVQWVVTLANGRDNITETLGFQANRQACIAVGLYV